MASESSTSVGGSESLTLHIRMTPTSARFTVGGSDSNISTNSTILEVKELIATTAESENCPVDRQRLIYKGRILSDDSRTLSDYGVVSDNPVLHLVRGSAPPTAPAPAPSTATPTPTAPTTASPTPNPFGQSARQGGGDMPPFNPFLMGAGGAGGMPDMSQMQESLLQNPEMMNSIMNSPMMQSMMSNPDFMRSMMEANPQMRQVLDSNPELRNLFNDPELMRRSMEAMRNPAAMQNMMRNQDLAMSQIENVPGGFSALRRMYEDVQEPMMDAMSGSGATATGGNSASGNGGASGGSDGAAGAAMPNPWGNTNPSGAANRSAGGGASGPGMSPMAGMANPWANAGMGAPPNPWSGAGAGAGGPNMNMDQMLQMLENPMVNQMMQQVMSDPNAFQSMMNNNPMLRQMRETNPAAASMMSNPETMRAMLDPNNLRAIMQMQNAMQQLGQNMPGFGAMMPPMGGAPFGGAPAAPGDGGLDFSSLLNQMQSTSISSGPPAPRATPEERFRIQLTSLNDMGFTDRDANIRALTESHGNVNRAVEVLLMNPPTPVAAPVSEPAASSSEIESSSSDAPSSEPPSSDTPDDNVDNKNADDKKND